MINIPIDVILPRTYRRVKLDQQQNVIATVKSGGRAQLEGLYYRYRKAFTGWAIQHYGISEEEAGEIYQRTFITFYYNIKEGKLTSMTSSEKTYLFAIGKNLIREHFRLRAKQAEPMTAHVEMESMDHGIMEKYEQNDRKETVKRLLAQIGEPCNSVLRMFYFDELSMKEIAAALDYKTEQIAAKRKFICLKQLRSLMQLTGEQQN